MLSLTDVVVHYGGVQALKGISLKISEGSITCLIGTNGAGKSTTLRAISGMVPLTSGEIRFQGRRIDGMEPQEIVGLGIGHVPEGKKLFLEMNVRDNLLSGAYLRRDGVRIQKDLRRICRFFPVLETAFNRPAANLSGGEQQMLAIGRGLMGSPKLLLLDEPSLGLSPLLTQEVGRIIKQIADEGVPILLIEQNAGLALSLADRGYVLETGFIASKAPAMNCSATPTSRKRIWDWRTNHRQHPRAAGTRDAAGRHAPPTAGDNASDPGRSASTASAPQWPDVSIRREIGPGEIRQVIPRRLDDIHLNVSSASSRQASAEDGLKPVGRPADRFPGQVIARRRRRVKGIGDTPHGQRSRSGSRGQKSVSSAQQPTERRRIRKAGAARKRKFRGIWAMETTIVVQVDFYATVQSAFGVKSMRVELNPPATVAQLLENHLYTGPCQGEDPGPFR